MKPIAIQLYSVRDYAVKDFPGTLRQIAEIGYKGVETAGLHGHDPKEIAKLIKDLGMVVCSAHGPLPTSENIQQIVDTESIFGNKTAISGFGPNDIDTLDKVKACAEKFQKASELCKQNGMTFGFHNHWWEFYKIDGMQVYDILMAEAPDAFSELDVYWAAYGKADPVAVVSEYKSRLPYLHIKDGPLEENAPHTAVGKGKVDIPAIINAADPNVTKWLVVELDSCATDMMQAVKDSYTYLTSNKLAEGNK